MAYSFSYLLGCLLAAVLFIIVLTVKFRIPAFFSLIAACFLTGAAVHMPLTDILRTIQEGFGNIMKSLGLIIVMGTTLGTLLEHNGSIRVIADFIIQKLGRKHIALSMNLIGFMVGMPVFCDSGYIILSSLNTSIAQRISISPYITSVSLAAGLLSVHCLIPPHPGASAAAALMGVDFGKLLLSGIIIAMPAALTGYAWARWSGKKTEKSAVPMEKTEAVTSLAPAVGLALLPIIVPVLLMAAKSLSAWDKKSAGMWQNFFAATGEPVVALAIGLLLAIAIWKNKKRKHITALLAEAGEKAGGILVIIGAGGAFGAILAAMHFAEHFSTALPLESMGIAFPFLLSLLLKTAQGSSTVAIITAASLTAPLLQHLHLDSDNGRLLCVLSMGAGSMIVSHANDAYFWVIAKFSSLEIKPMFRIYSLATLWMGLISFAMVCILSLLLPH